MIKRYLKIAGIVIVTMFIGFTVTTCVVFDLNRMNERMEKTREHNSALVKICAERGGVPITNAAGALERCDFPCK